MNRRYISLRQPIRWMVLASLIFGLTNDFRLSAQSQPLRWKFAAGNRYTIRVTQATSLETEVDLVKQTMESNSTIESEWLVESTDESGAAKVKMTIRSIRLKVAMPVANGLRTIEVDTASPPTHPSDLESDTIRNLQVLLGREIGLTVSARGEISDVALDAATKDALRQVPQSMQVRQLLSAEGLAEMFASGAPLLPEKEVKPGESWSIGREFAGVPGRFRRDQTLTWIGPETHDNLPQERIDVSARLTLLDPPEKGESSSELPRPQIKSQVSTGTIWFDPQRGMITQGSVDAALKTESPYREKTIVVQLKSRVDLTMSKID